MKNTNITEAIWKEYHSKLLAFIIKRVENYDIAEDILQEAFIKIYSHVDTVDEDLKLERWIFKLVNNLVIDHYRTRKQFDPLPVELINDQSQPNEYAIQELEGCLQPMIKKLPEKYKQALVLFETQGISMKETSKALGISISGTKSRVQRGRNLLKGMLYECCQFETDSAGKVLDYNKKSDKKDCC